MSGPPLRLTLTRALVLGGQGTLMKCRECGSENVTVTREEARYLKPTSRLVKCVDGGHEYRLAGGPAANAD